MFFLLCFFKIITGSSERPVQPAHRNSKKLSWLWVPSHGHELAASIVYCFQTTKMRRSWERGSSLLFSTPRALDLHNYLLLLFSTARALDLHNYLLLLFSTARALDLHNYLLLLFSTARALDLHNYLLLLFSTAGMTFYCCCSVKGFGLT